MITKFKICFYGNLLCTSYHLLFIVILTKLQDYNEELKELTLPSTFTEPTYIVKMNQGSLFPSESGC